MQAVHHLDPFTALGMRAFSTYLSRSADTKILGNLHKSFFILEGLNLLLQMLQPHLLPAYVGFMMHSDEYPGGG